MSYAPSAVPELDPATMLTNVFYALRRSDPSLENISYSYSTQNSLLPGWLIQSAPQNPTCPLLNKIKAQLDATVAGSPDKPHFIDLTQMGNQDPDDSFQASVLDSLIAIAKTARQKVVVRYLEGGSVLRQDSRMTVIEHLKNACTGLALSNVYFYAAYFAIPWQAPGVPPGLQGAWTHAKIFAVDGVASIAGGQNYWNDYMPGHLDNPPHDVSMQIDGAATAAAHYFANFLWRYVSANSSSMTHKTLRLGAPDYDDSLPPQFDANQFPTPTQQQGVPVLAVGNLGAWLPVELDALKAEALDGVRNPQRQVHPKDTYPVVEDAYNVLLDFPLSAKFDTMVSMPRQASIAACNLLFQAVQVNGHLRISQQKIADTDLVQESFQGIHGVPWPGPFIRNIVSAIIYWNVTVDIIVSNHVAGDSPVDGYSDDMGAAALQGVILDFLTLELGNHRAKAEAVANQYLHVRSTVASNHAKVWTVDDKVFFVGSDNIYPAYLQEFGFVVGSTQRTQEFIDKYWTPLWNNAVPPSQ